MLQRIVKDCTAKLSLMARYAKVERIFSLMQPQCPKGKRKLSSWVSFQSIKAGVQFKTYFMQAETSSTLDVFFQCLKLIHIFHLTT